MSRYVFRNGRIIERETCPKCGAPNIELYERAGHGTFYAAHQCPKGGDHLRWKPLQWKPSPRRVQLRRFKGWRMPENTVKVDRSTKWGNPFKVGYAGIQTEHLAVEFYRFAVVVRSNAGLDTMRRALSRDGDNLENIPTVEEIRRELAGKNLACWCKPGMPCHADLLLKIANQPGGSQ